MIFSGVGEAGDREQETGLSWGGLFWSNYTCALVGSWCFFLYDIISYIGG